MFDRTDGLRQVDDATQILGSLLFEMESTESGQTCWALAFNQLPVAVTIHESVHSHTSASPLFVDIEAYAELWLAVLRRCSWYQVGFATLLVVAMPLIIVLQYWQTRLPILVTDVHKRKEGQHLGGRIFRPFADQST